MSADLGDLAPVFVLPGIEQGERRTFSLEQYRGAPVVLAFYPGDNTPGCTAQLCSYRDEIESFADLGAALLGISPQSVDSHDGFATKRSLPFPLLADTDLAVAKEYGVAAPIIHVRRSIFILDGEGIIRYKHVALVGITHRRPAQLLRVLESLTGA